MKDEVPVSKRNRSPGKAASRISQKKDADRCPVAAVRRPSGRTVIFGLLVSALALQAGLMLGLHGYEWSREGDSLDPGIWDALRRGQTSTSSPNHAVATPKLPAFYPPQDWDRGLLSKSTDGQPEEAPSITYATPSFSALLNFMRNHMPFTTDHACVPIPQRETREADYLGPFRQASSLAP